VNGHVRDLLCGTLQYIHRHKDEGFGEEQAQAPHAWGESRSSPGGNTCYGQN